MIAAEVMTATFDEAAAGDFLARWFAAVPPGALLEVRPLNKRGPRPVSQGWFADVQPAVAHVARAAANGDDVYLGALPRTTASGKESAVGARCFVWADVDYGTIGHAKPAAHATHDDALAALAVLPEPTLLVDTGGGLHAWWALAAEPSPEDWRAAMARIVAALHADANTCDPPRILRVPGTVNHKAGLERPVRLVSSGAVVASVAPFLALPAPAPAPARVAPAATSEGPQGGTASGGAMPGSGRPFDSANDIPVAEVLEWLGVVMHREGARTFCACPVHRGKNTGQMVVGGTVNVATCFGDCGGRHYSPVDLVAAARGIDPREAVNALAERFGFRGLAGPGPAKTSAPSNVVRIHDGTAVDYDADERAAIQGEAAAVGAAAAPGPPPTAVGAVWAPLDVGLLSTKPPARRWLLRHPSRDGAPCAPGAGDGMLPLGKVGLLSSEGGGGKTNALLGLAVAVATGRRWFDHFDVDHGARRGRVLLGLAQEDAEEIHRRLYTAAEAFKLTPAEREHVAAQIVALPLAGRPVALVQYGGYDGRTVVDSAELRELRSRLEGDAGPDGWSCVVLDPLARWAGVEVEADNSIATRFIQALETLTSVPGRPTVLVAHHSSKIARRTGSVDSRGVTALTDGVRWASTLRAERGDVFFVQSKSNYSIPMPDELALVRGPGGLLRVPNADEAGRREAAAEARELDRATERDRARDARRAVRLAEHVERVVAAATDQPQSGRELGDAAALCREDAVSAVNAAVAAGRLVAGNALRGHPRYTRAGA